MVLKKILLVFDPPGIGLVIVENNEDKIIHFNLTDLHEQTNTCDLVTRILEGQPRNIVAHKDAIHTAILKIQTRLICNNKYIQSAICLNHFLPITNIAINNFDTKCITGSYDRTARIWDLENCKELASLNGHSNVVFSVCFNGKSDKVLTGSFDKSSKIWDAITGKNMRTYWGHTGEVLVSAFLPDEEAVASCSTDGTIRVFQTETGQETGTYMGHKKDIISLQMSAERNFVISGSFDRTIRIWDMRISACVHVLCGHEAEISSCKIAADSSLLVSGGFDGRTIVWDLRKMKYFKIFLANNSQNNEKILDVDIKDEHVVACTSNSNAQIWNINTSSTKQLSGHKKAVSIINFNPSKDEIMTCSEDQTIRIWKLDFHDFSNDILEHGGPVTSGIYSRNGQKVISICANNSCKIWCRQNSFST